MSKSLVRRCAALVFDLLIFAAILHSGTPAVQAGWVSFDLVPFSDYDKIDGAGYWDTISGTITAPTGTYTNATIATVTLEAVVRMTKTKLSDSTSVTITDSSYTGYKMSDFVRSGTLYIQNDGIYLSKANGGDAYLNKDHGSGNPYVVPEWYAGAGWFLAAAGYQGTSATMQINNNSGANSIFDPGDTGLWKIANASSVPEPATLLLCTLGLSAIVVARCKRQRSKEAVRAAVFGWSRRSDIVTQSVRCAV